MCVFTGSSGTTGRATLQHIQQAQPCFVILENVPDIQEQFEDFMFIRSRLLDPFISTFVVALYLCLTFLASIACLC
jgi:hypothetical protein